MRVALVPPALKTSRWHVVEELGVDSGSGVLAKLSGVDDLGRAQALVGSTLLACVDELPLGYELHDVDALVGRVVRDERLGDLGTIEEVMRGPAQDVWVIRGPYGEVLMPVVEEFVRDLKDPEALLVRLPEGLVDLEEGNGRAL